MQKPLRKKKRDIGGIVLTVLFWNPDEKKKA